LGFQKCDAIDVTVGAIHFVH